MVEPSEERFSTPGFSWLRLVGLALVLARVMLVIGFWLLLFVVVFLGYLTIPLAAMLGLCALYYLYRLGRALWRRLRGIF